jgi:hypothetical protein
VEGLKVKLAAAEAALTERDERDAETQRERASSTHAGVMDEADRLGDEMKGALGNVKAFMRRAWTGEKGHPNEDDSDAGDMNRHGTGTPSAMRSKAKTSIVEKPSARGAYVRHPDASPRVGFVGDREQRRLEKEGEVVADNARLRREVVELEQRLARLARVARSAHDAAESRFEEERRMRIDAEKLVERLRAASGDGSNALVEELETSRQLCRDVLLVTRACANVSQADPNAVVAALPALATLASNKRGDSALILATNGVPRHAAAAMETHGKDAQVATHACELIAALARGGEPSVLRGLAGSARKAAAAVAKQLIAGTRRRAGQRASQARGRRGCVRGRRGCDVGGGAPRRRVRRREAPRTRSRVGAREVDAFTPGGRRRRVQVRARDLLRGIHVGCERGGGGEAGRRGRGGRREGRRGRGRDRRVPVDGAVGGGGGGPGSRIGFEF